jgi:hypothetical protein
LSAGAMHAASAAFPALAFHAVTAFGLGCELAAAGAAISAAVVSTTAKRRTEDTAASNRLRLARDVTSGPLTARARGPR